MRRRDRWVEQGSPRDWTDIIILAFVALVLLLCASCLHEGNKNDCEAKGGTYVHTYRYHYECEEDDSAR